MVRTLRSLLLAAFMAAFFSTTAFAQGWCNGQRVYIAYFQGSYSPVRYEPCHGWEGNGHVFGSRQIIWNQAGRDGVQSYVRRREVGRRFSLDMTDLGRNLSATRTYATTFPSPYIDFDDDNGDGKLEEAEVTVEDSSFPVVNRAYQHFFWYRWVGPSNGTGNLAHTPGISQIGISYPIYGDKWDTLRYDRAVNWHYSRYGNLFDDESQFKEPLKQFFESTEIEQEEKVKLPEPISIEEFTNQMSQMNLIGTRLIGFAMEYEIDTEDGPQVLTVGLVPNENELVPSKDMQDVLSTLPSTFKITRFRGVVSYELSPMSEKTERVGK